jgi:hypothetical protein
MVAAPEAKLLMGDNMIFKVIRKLPSAGVTDSISDMVCRGLLHGCEIICNRLVDHAQFMRFSEELAGSSAVALAVHGGVGMLLMATTCAYTTKLQCGIYEIRKCALEFPLLCSIEGPSAPDAEDALQMIRRTSEHFRMSQVSGDESTGLLCRNVTNQRDLRRTQSDRWQTKGAFYICPAQPHPLTWTRGSKGGCATC